MYIQPENMFDALCDGHNLVIAYRKALKAVKKPETKAYYLVKQPDFLLKIHEELRAEQYKPGPYQYVTIFEPKRRQICVPPFKDRVVHHALNNIIGPILEANLHPGSYACQKKKGTHSCVDAAQAYMRNNNYLCQGDVEKFFDSVDQQLLFVKIKDKIKDKQILILIRNIIKAYHTPGKEGKGLPIGSLTSQLFANFYLSDFDWQIEEWLGPQRLVRYMDDWIVFVNNKNEAWKLEGLMRKYLEEKLFLAWKPEKVRLTPTRAGVPFLGVYLKPNSRRLNQKVMLRAKKHIRQVLAQLEACELDSVFLKQEIGTWMGRGTIIGGENHAYIRRIKNTLYSSFYHNA